MTSSAPGRPSMPNIPSKKSSSASYSSTLGIKPNTKRATSDDGISQIVSAPLAREFSSGFNYQTLPETPSLNQSILPIRSHSSSNADISYHLQQLRNLSKRKGTFNSEEKTTNEDRIHLTSSNLKITCNENGKESTVHSTMELKTIETSIELPVSWKPAKQQTTIQRESWDHKIEFLLAVIGYAVDLGNVWRFPITVFENGGGVFFIPYFILLFFGGLPLFYMELALGQYHRSGVFTIWKHICPLVKGIGWATVLINLMTGMFYNTVISWAVYYLVKSFVGVTGELPWKGCLNQWNTNCCRPADVTTYTPEYEKLRPLPIDCPEWVHSTEEYFVRHLQHMHEDNNFNNLGKIKWELALSLFAVFIIVYFALWKGIKSSGKAVWITATAPYAVLFILLIRGITLEGAGKGINFYLKPNMTALPELKIWNAAATQIFFSLGPGFGVLMALSSYNKFHNNCYRDAMVTSGINCATSILSGFVVFSTLGHMAHVSNKAVKDVIQNKGTDLVFVVYPHTIALMNWSTLWSVLFFFMVITLGIDSTFGGLESIITGLCDEFPNVFGRHRPLFVLGVLIICYLGALPTCTYGGAYIVALMNEVCVSPALLLVVFVECIAVAWFYGVNRFSRDVKAMIGSRPSLYWRVVWYIISPLFLLIIFYTSMETLLDGQLLIRGVPFYDLPQHVKIWSYVMVVSPMLCIPGYAIYKLFITPGKTFEERLQRAVRPEEPVLDLIHSRSTSGPQQEKTELL